jgi:hypothetical protein
VSSKSTGQVYGSALFALALVAGLAADGGGFAPTSWGWSTVAAAAVAAWLLAGAGALAVALARGRAGAPCGCLGSASRVSRAAVGRNLAFAAAFAAVPSLPAGDPTAETWLALGLGVALLAIAALTVAVLSVAREVAELRLRAGPQAALEIPHEGPEVGSRTALINQFDRDARTRFALAVFTSEGCAVCRSLDPAVALVARDPLVALRVFDEHRDEEAWRALDVPGAPYAVALSLDGTVRAKGTFNSAAQLESVLAAAERREREALHA